MALTQAICNSFKQELLEAKHNFLASGGHAFKIALYTSAATTLGAATTVYTTTGEVTGSAGYTAAGVALTNVNPSLSSATAMADWSNDPTWSTSTITARGALIYNTSTTSPANRAVMVLDFGSDKVSTAGDFIIQFPAADATNAIIRIA